MSKKKSVLSLILIAACIALSAYTALVGWGEKHHTGRAKNIKLGLDLQGGVSITYEVATDDFSTDDFNDTKYKLEQRVQNFSTEAEVYKEGDNRIVCNIPGESNAEEVLAELGKPGSLYFATAISAEEITEDMETVTVGDATYQIWLSGSDIKNAKPATTTDSTTSATEYVVSLTFTKDGAEKFSEATAYTAGLGTGANYLYIIYDGEIISSPRCEQAITGGKAQIDGMENYEEADKLSSNIRIGSLKLELNEISHSVNGASLGDKALSRAIKAGLIGTAIVVIFMIFVYRLPGFISGICLAFYALLDLLLLNGFDLTLTLPGIAGIILSIGMAVDANVIIYARIREEIAAGRPVDLAIKAGFSKAASAIIDGNVTTIIAALVLMWKGSGTVQGFAQTLAIGIILSMFTALVIARILVYAFYSLGAKNPALYGEEKHRKHFDFVGHKKVFFAISIVCILIGVITMGVNTARGKKAFALSIEFVGGKSYNVTFDKEYSISQFNDDVKPAIAEIIGSNDIQGSKERDSNAWTIKIPKDISESKVTEMKKLFVDNYGAKEDEIVETYISSTVSKEMASNAVVATIIATICMLIYIWFRFKDIGFAGAAVIALLHDVMIVLGFYAISRISVGTTLIACILTIVGYSINATIVIFDRIRENLKIRRKGETKAEIVNNSIMQTMTRSIYTSFTTFITIFMVYIYGVASIKEFALPLMVGIICGAYSSVFVTGSLWTVFSRKSVK